MKKNRTGLLFVATLLPALLLSPFTTSEVAAIRTQQGSRDMSLLQITPSAVPSGEITIPRPLSPSQLFSVVGADTSDGAPGSSPDYCQQAYCQCVANCRSMAAGWAFLSGFGGQFARSYLTAWGGGCWTGCQIGFLNCG